MKFICSILISGMVVFLSACRNLQLVHGDPSSDDTQNHTNALEETAHQILTSDILLNSYLQVNEKMSLDVIEVGLKNLIVIKKVDGYTTCSDEKGFSAYILGDYRYGEQDKHDSYLAVEIKDNVIFYDLENYSYDESLYLCDVDGDDMDELIVHQHIDSFGGAGQYLSRVFRVDHEKISEIFNSNDRLLSNTDAEMFDTGFVSEFLEGYKLKIKNDSVGYSTILDISHRYTDDFFDENGKCKRNIRIWCDSFMKFEPRDIDGDGVFEIECLQYVSLDGHADGIGYANSILKWNPLTEALEVIHADFVEEN